MNVYSCFFLGSPIVRYLINSRIYAPPVMHNCITNRIITMQFRFKTLRQFILMDYYKTIMGRGQAVRQQVLVLLFRRFESFRPRWNSIIELKKKRLIEGKDDFDKILNRERDIFAV
jgi:hypothetical protein